MKNKVQSPKSKLYIVVGVITLISILVRVINHFQFEQTSILFIGIPALLSVLMIKYTSTPKNIFGVVFRIITLFLLLSGILVGEGMVCILMAAPIFYAVGAIVSLIIYALRKKKNKNQLSVIALAPLLLILAQPTDYIFPNPLQTVTSETVVPLTDMANFRSIDSTVFDLPQSLSIGFPTPEKISGHGINVGDTRTIDFLSSTKGIGQLVLQITSVDDQHIVLQPIEDHTHIAHWLQWTEFRVELEEIEGQTKVKWSSSYYCVLGPSWYFRPIEKEAVEVMNQHLMHAIFN